MMILVSVRGFSVRGFSQQYRKIAGKTNEERPSNLWPHDPLCYKSSAKTMLSNWYNMSHTGQN